MSRPGVLSVRNRSVDTFLGTFRGPRSDSVESDRGLACVVVTLRSIAHWFDPRRRVITALLAAWVAIVVIGAGNHPRGSKWIAVPDLGGLVAAILGLTALVGAVMTVVMRHRRRNPKGPRGSRSIRGLMLLTIGVVGLALAFGPRDIGEGELLPEQPVTAEPEIAPTETEVEDDGVDRREIVTLVLVVIVTAGVLVWSRSRVTADPSDVRSDEDQPLVQDLGPALDQATTFLMHGRDPRTAVLAAYAELERALSDRGRSRDPAETPTEHLARVLGSDPVVAEPAVRLGALYELARFSDHPITATDQHHAATALDRARHELAAPAGAP